MGERKPDALPNGMTNVVGADDTMRDDPEAGRLRQQKIEKTHQDRRSRSPPDSSSSSRHSGSHHRRRRRHRSASPSSSSESEDEKRHKKKSKKSSSRSSSSKSKKKKSKRRKSDSDDDDSSDDDGDHRRNPITGKKVDLILTIKLKIHKTSDDKRRDENRSNLLDFLNSAF
ncbi:hypothetical protein [Absidia glauca]|uniref:Uncharacterized protein n=1 Tax=Absidia glauca TaxID=4829 RepID=A0A163KLH1_ABSGL|nr:hypothetical protein [Absidia glauca]